MKLFSFLAILFLASNIVYGQNKSWVTVLRSADSIYLISHGLIKGTSITALDSSGKEVNQPLFINGKLNNSIVEKKKLLTAADIKELIAILSHKSNEVPDEAKCYVPQHAIIIIKREKFSYIEMSFSCQIYNTSQDITLPQIKNETWKKLIAFFSKHGIVY